MPKSLGQIHTANLSATVASTGDKVLVDIPGILTNKIQRMVRQGQYFKVVGIDMTCRDMTGVTGEVAVSGVLEYYAPTEGRCEAYKNAYGAVRRAMKLQGINIRGNQHYDFRVPLSATTGFVNGGTFLNQTTFDGTNQLTLDDTAGSATDQVFEVYNSNIQPEQTAAVDFSAGFGFPGATGGSATDFVLNEGEYHEGSRVAFAEMTKEQIPFSISFGSDGALGTSSTMMFQWRPDPALYLAVLTGQFSVVCDDLNDSVPGTSVNLEISVHVSGWKSIMGSKDRKRRSTKSSASKKKEAKR